jgi:hypothetical protein
VNLFQFVQSAIALSILTPTFVFAQKPEVKLDIYSVERNRCSEWLSAGYPSQSQTAHYFWFLGFVSGGNFAIPKDQVKPDRMLSEREFIRLITAKCKSDPNLTVSVVVLDFVESNVQSAKKP